jgi:two-component system, sensor histidine kinase PdtaS
VKAGDEHKWSFWPRALSLRSMRGRMALLLALAMLPAGAIAMQVGLNAVDAQRNAYAETLSRRALQSISAERNVVDEVREMLRVLAATPALQQIERGDCRQWLGSVVERYQYLASLGVTSDDNVLRCSVPVAPVGFRANETSLRSRARARGGLSMGLVENSPLTHLNVLGAVEPIIDQSGRRVGFVGASIDVQYLNALLREGPGRANARAAIVDYEGRVVADSALPGDETQPPLPTPAQIRRHLGDDPSFISVKGAAAVVAPLHAPDIYAVMSWATEPPSWRSWGGLALSIAAPLLIWMFAIGAGWLAIEVYVTRPLSELDSAARSFARGEEVTDSRALASAPVEIRGLRRTMAAMAKTLRGREQRLVEALAEERALLREVNHRVKNNLQMVASLLNIQARGARDESEAWGLARAHDRVQLLALVHQRIYASGEVRELRLDELTTEMTRQLLQSRNLQATRVAYDFTETRVKADRAVPLAFLIGEGISAALDSLREGHDFSLRLHLHQDANGEVRFAIESEGEGPMPKGPPINARLVEAFARQLGGVIGRSSERPMDLWARVPEEPDLSG